MSEHRSIVLGTRRDCDPVPAIDLHRREDQPCDLLVAEVRLQGLKRLLACAALGNQSQFLGPGEGGALLVRIERRLFPGIERHDPLGSLAMLQGFVRVHG